MKKYITSLVMVVMMAVSIPMLSVTVEAQRSRGSYDSRYYDNGYYNDGYYDNRSTAQRTYDRHRQAVNVGAGAAAGAILGALFGGKKGALIGAGVGALGGVVVTKKQAPRNYERYRY